jgi:hypothetical protein
VVNDIEKAYYGGFVEALLFAQASNDVEGGSQTLKTHLPSPTDTDWRGFLFDPIKMIEAIKELDEEAGIVMWRMGRDEYNSVTVELAGSEGYHGLPDWT